MKIMKRLFLALPVVAVIVAVGAGQAGLLQGQAPDDLGVKDGRLKQPSPTDNSVSSQAALSPGHPQLQNSLIEPIALRGDGPATISKIKAIVEATPGAAVVTSHADYLYAQFTSPLMKFVDDAEFWYDRKAGYIAVRSASRIGSGDFGANRKRIEAIRKSLDALR